jgi:hypothetical protein
METRMVPAKPRNSRSEVPNFINKTYEIVNVSLDPYI